MSLHAIKMYNGRSLTLKFDSGDFLYLSIFCGDRSFPRQTLPRRTVPRGQFPDRTFPRTVISPTGHFPDRTFPRQDISPTGCFPDWTFPRTDNTPTGQFPERIIPRLYLFFQLTRSIYNSPVSILISMAFLEKKRKEERKAQRKK